MVELEDGPLIKVVAKLLTRERGRAALNGSGWSMSTHSGGLLVQELTLGLVVVFIVGLVHILNQGLQTSDPWHSS